MSSTADRTDIPFEGERSVVLFAVLRIFALVVLALMLVSILYSGWISIENWASINV